jgi:hypothetical protein
MPHCTIGITAIPSRLTSNTKERLSCYRDGTHNTSIKITLRHLQHIMHVKEGSLSDIQWHHHPDHIHQQVLSASCHLHRFSTPCLHCLRSFVNHQWMRVKFHKPTLISLARTVTLIRGWVFRILATHADSLLNLARGLPHRRHINRAVFLRLMGCRLVEGGR